MQLFECLEQIWSSDTLKRHAVLIGEGGSGKTTQLKKLWCDLSHNSALNAPIPIYAPLYGFNGSDTYILDYVNREYCGQLTGENDEQNRTNLLHLFKQTDDSNRRFVLLLDGINEAQNWNEIITEINEHLSNCKNLQIVISSRYKLNDFKDFTQLHVKPLTVDFVNNKLREKTEYKDYQFSDKLLSLLTNPMYLSIFLGLELDIPEIETKNISSAGEIFKANNDRLIKAILHNLKKSEESKIYRESEYLLTLLLPFCAKVLNKVYFRYHELKNALKYGDKILSETEIGETYDDVLIRDDDVKAKHFIDNLLIKTSIISKISKTEYKFSHENYLQFYTALYYYNEMTLCPDGQAPAFLTDSLINENLLSWIGELFGEHNFMHKTTLQESASPLESWLHNHCEIDKSNCNDEELARATRNVIAIMKVARKNNLTADYSNLDLTMCDFYGCSLPNSNFENAKINRICFVSESHNNDIRYLSVSDDGNYITSSDGESVKIWAKDQFGLSYYLKSNYGYPGSQITSVAITNELSMFAMTLKKYEIFIWPFKNYSPFGEFYFSDIQPIDIIKFSPDERFLAIGYTGGNIKLVDLEDHISDDLQLYHVKCKSKYEKITDLRFFNNCNSIAFISCAKNNKGVSTNYSIEVLNLETDVLTHIISTNDIPKISVSTNDELIIALSHSIEIWKWDGLKHIKDRMIKTEEYIFNLSIIDDAVVCLENLFFQPIITFRVLNNENIVKQTISLEDSFLLNVLPTFSSNGRYFLTCSYDNTITCVDLKTRNTFSIKKTHRNHISNMILDGKYCAFQLFTTDIIKVFDINDFKICYNIQAFNSLDGYSLIGFSYKYKKIAIANNYDNLTIFSFTGSIVCSCDRLFQYSDLKKVIFSEEKIIGFSQSGLLCFWDYNGKIIKTIQIPIEQYSPISDVVDMVHTDNNQIMLLLKNQLFICDMETFSISHTKTDFPIKIASLTQLAKNKPGLILYDSETILTLPAGETAPYYEVFAIDNDTNVINRIFPNSSKADYGLFNNTDLWFKNVYFSNKNNSLVSVFYNDTSIKFTIHNNSICKTFQLIDAVDIQNSDFSNTDISDELKELLEMNGGIVN